MSDSVKLVFDGQDYTVRPKHVFRTARAVEDVITVTEMVILAQRNALPYARLASAYTLALKKAGAVVAEEDVFSWLFEGGEGEDQNVFKAMEVLTMILVPASARKVFEKAGEDQGGGDVPLD